MSEALLAAHRAGRVRVFGDHAATSLEEGLRQTLAWYREEARRAGKAVLAAA